MVIEMDKRYRTKAGKEVRILCVDANPQCPTEPSVVALVLYGDTGPNALCQYEANGEVSPLGFKNIEAWKAHKDDWQLVEIPPYEGFEIDDPVMVRNKASEGWKRGHFAGLSDHDYPCTWVGGKTSWSVSANSRAIWTQMRRPTPEELGDA